MTTATFANPWIGTDRVYIPDTQAMPVPPAHFLAALHDQDAMLVLLPSRQTPFTYVLARRRQLTAALTFMDVDEQTPPDTRMCLQYGVLPVCRLVHHGPAWDPDPVIAALRARDLWAQGGADAVADRLEAEEAQAEADQKAAIRDDLWHRSGDGWRTYQARTGQRILTTDLSPQPEPRTVLAPSGSTAGSGSVTAGHSVPGTE